MLLSKYQELDTPSLLIDMGVVRRNIERVQKIANEAGVGLRPHTKTHKLPKIAKMQLEAGACGIAVAKTDEALVMAEAGIDDIFIANQVVGCTKLEKLRQLNRCATLSVGIDSVEAVEQIESVFSGEEKRLDVLIEIEVGEQRSGVVSEEDMRTLVRAILRSGQLRLKGVYSHDGHTYRAASIDECSELSLRAQERTLRFAEIAREEGAEIETVSVGSTPPALLCGLLPGITELRIGTYVFMDAGQSNAIGSYDMCAATVLATVTSLPTDERIITDTGAKALTAQTRASGICRTEGLGLVKGSGGVCLSCVFDEHGIIYDRELRGKLKIGDKIEIIPNHICPVVNLYDEVCLVEDGKVLGTLAVAGRGKTK